MKNNVVITILACAIVGAIAFYGGMQYQKSQRPSFGGGSFANGQGGSQRGSQNGSRFGGGRGGFGGAVVGEILSVDGDSLTVKLMDGSSKIVNISDKTTISKTDKAAKSDLKKGDNVAAFGQANSDGSVDAQNIQLNPMFRTTFGSDRRPTGSNQ